MPGTHAGHSPSRQLITLVTHASHTPYHLLIMPVAHASHTAYHLLSTLVTHGSNSRWSPTLSLILVSVRHPVTWDDYVVRISTAH